MQSLASFSRRALATVSAMALSVFLISASFAPPGSALLVPSAQAATVLA